MNKSNRRPFLSTAVFTIAGRAGGLILHFVIAFYYGVNAETDAFFFSYGIVTAIIAVSLYAVWHTARRIEGLCDRCVD